MTREEASKTLIENLCAMCAYGSQNMESCDIRSCDNRDAIKAIEQESIAEERYQDLVEYFGDEDIAKCVLEDREEFKKWLERVRWHTRKVDELARKLEQQSCEDCWSKKEVVDIINRQRFGINKISMGIIKEKLEALPSVTPTRIETVTEFADRCRECGKMKKGKWIFSKTIFDKYGYTVECSSCHKKWKTYDEIRWKKENKYCSNCGDKKESEE